MLVIVDDFVNAFFQTFVPFRNHVVKIIGRFRQVENGKVWTCGGSGILLGGNGENRAFLVGELHNLNGKIIPADLSPVGEVVNFLLLYNVIVIDHFHNE